MKKLTFLLLVAVSAMVSFQASAQESGIHLGLKAGVNGNKIEGVALDEEFTYNYLLGGFVMVPLSGKLGVQPEVLFVQGRTTVSNDPSQPFNANNPNNRDIKLNYLSIPLLLTYGNNIKLQVGPQYSILMNRDQSLVANGREAFKSGDFSVVGGLQWRLPIAGLHVGARYVIGLSELDDLGSNQKWKNEALQLSAGLIF
jgi:hypothetical protein